MSPEEKRKRLIERQLRRQQLAEQRAKYNINGRPRTDPKRDDIDPLLEKFKEGKR